MTERAAGDPYRPVPSLGPPPRRVPRSVALYVIIGNIGLQCLSIVGSVTSIALYLSLSQGSPEWEFVLADLVPLLLLGLYAMSPPTERRSLELLRTGEVAAAKIVKQEKIAEGRRWRWVLTFEFEDEGGEKRRFARPEALAADLVHLHHSAGRSRVHGGLDGVVQAPGGPQEVAVGSFALDDRRAAMFVRTCPRGHDTRTRRSGAAGRARRGASSGLRDAPGAGTTGVR